MSYIYDLSSCPHKPGGKNWVIPMPNGIIPYQMHIYQYRLYD